MRAAAGLVALVALSAPAARADDVARVALPGEISSLVAGPDGGAWIGIQRARGWAVGRANADGRFRTTALSNVIGEGTLGPDGAAFFPYGGSKLARVDAAGAVTFSATVTRRSSEFLAFALATGPDARLWATTLFDGNLARITPAGQGTFTRLKLPACDIPLLATAMTRASDGTVWIADTICERLIHLSAAGAPTVVKVDGHLPATVTGDTAGGVWFGEREVGLGGHVDAVGRVSYVRHGEDGGFGVAVAPDGAAWFAVGRCALVRVAPDGAMTEQPSPLPAQSLAFDPSGGLWLASRTQLAHRTLAALGAGACDDTPPRITVTHAKRINLAALRRGLRITVHEPAYVSALATLSYGASGKVLDPRERLFVRPGTLRLRLSAAQLRRLARAKRPALRMLVRAEDRNGNLGLEQVNLRVTR